MMLNKCTPSVDGLKGFEHFKFEPTHEDSIPTANGQRIIMDAYKTLGTIKLAAAS